MPLEDFIILVYSVVDDWFSQLARPLRQRGYPPAFTDAEVGDAGDGCGIYGV